jgi:HK97 family phage major capsid protein
MRSKGCSSKTPGALRLATPNRCLSSDNSPHNQMRFKFKYPSLLATLGSLALVFVLCTLGLLSLPGAFLLLAAAQLLALSQQSPRRGLCLLATLTQAQVEEFENICESLRVQLTDSKADATAMRRELDEVRGNQRKMQKNVAFGSVGRSGVVWIGNKPFVTDDCATALTSVFVLETDRLGDGALSNLVKDASAREGVLNKAKTFLGLEQKTAMTTTQIPVPTIYVPQIIELVFAYGQARQFATVFPLGAGTVKLPMLAAGEDNFGYLGAGTAGMSQSVPERRVTANLVTFTANKAGGMIRIPTELEEDTFVPLGQFLARYIARQLALLEDKSMFMADGTSTYASIVGIQKYCQTNTAYLTVLGSTKTHPSDAVIADFRSIRPLVNAAVLANMNIGGKSAAAYFMHPSMDALLVTFNTINNPLIYQHLPDGSASLDGYPIHWIGVSQAFSSAAAPSTPLAFFGDLSYWYLGERGAPRVEVSKEVFFATDELAMRALERIDVEAMAVDAMSTLQTAAA